jgi:hypothetical protein
MSPAASEAMLLHRDILPHHLYKDDNKLSKDQKKALKDKGNRGALRGGVGDGQGEGPDRRVYCRRNNPRDDGGNESDVDPDGGDIPEGQHSIQFLGKITWRRNGMTGRKERGFWVRWEGCTAAEDTWEPEPGLPAWMVAAEVEKGGLVAGASDA